MKEKTLKYVKENWLFIAIILLGTIFLLIPAFHENIWLDESYSVAIVKPFIWRNLDNWFT